MKKVILAGNAVTAEILHAYLAADARYTVVGAVVDDAYVESGTLEGVPCVGISQVTAAYAPGEHVVVMAMGYDNLNRSRQSVFERLQSMGYAMETYVHPDARVYTTHAIGQGSVVLPGATLEPFVTLGANSMIWCNVTLAHHSTVEDHCWVASGSVLSGQAVVRRNSFVGVNATIVNKVEIGEYNIVGGGALMTKCTKPSAVHLARSGEPFRYSSEEYIKFFGV